MIDLSVPVGHDDRAAAVSQQVQFQPSPCALHQVGRPAEESFGESGVSPPIKIDIIPPISEHRLYVSAY